MGKIIRDSPFSRVQIIEFGEHLQQLEQLAFLFRRAAKLQTHVRTRNRSFDLAGFPWLRSIGNPLVSEAFFSKARGTLSFYIGIMRAIKRRDILWISTGPEQGRWSDLIFFGLLILLFRARLVLTIRGVSQWVVDAHTYAGTRRQTAFRSCLVSLVPRLVFESERQMAYFLSQTERGSRDNAHTASLCTSFSDYAGLLPSPIKDLAQMDHQEVPAQVSVGLLGGFDEERRDYRTLIEALLLMDEELRKKLLLVPLGNLMAQSSGRVIGELEAVVQVVKSPAFLSAKEMLDRGKATSFLIAPLRLDRGYGYAHGTGAIGDSIWIRRKVLLPSQCDPEGEFLGVTVPFDSAPHLALLLADMLSKPAAATLGHGVTAKYESTSNLNRIFHSLRFFLSLDKNIA